MGVYMYVNVCVSGCPLQGKIRENREFCEKKFPAGKNQGIWGKWVK